MSPNYIVIVIIFSIWSGQIDEFPSQLTDQYGLKKEKLLSIIQELQSKGYDHRPSSWKFEDTAQPTIGLYRKLHIYLKHQPNLTDVLIGRLYCTIDGKFHDRPDNVYRFVDNVVSNSTASADDLMLYTSSTNCNSVVTESTSKMLENCTQTIKHLNAECAALKKKIEVSRSQLKAKTRALRDITNENQCLKKKAENSKIKICNLKAANTLLETECTRLEIENLDFHSDDESVESDEEWVIGPTNSSTTSNSEELIFQNIVGHRKYSPEIRKLYYTLLAEQVPVSKISDIVRSVLKCFSPDINLEDLKLPKKSCASYMRKEELKTISDCHKAHVLCQEASEGKGN